MALSAFIVVFSTRADDPDKTLPSAIELQESFKEYLGIPDDETGVNLWPVTIEAMGYDPSQCRKCGTELDEEQAGVSLFCDKCASDIAQKPT